MFLILALESGCTRTDIQPNMYNEKGEIRIKNFGKYDIESPDLELTMVGVLRDSRCPTDGDCISDDNAEVSFDFELEEHHTSFTLNTNNAPVGRVVDGYHVQLISLSPQPANSKTINPYDYEVIVSLTKQ